MGRVLSEILHFEMIEMVNLEDIRSRTQSVRKYIEGMKEKDREKFLSVYNDYQLNQDAAKELREYAPDISIVVISAAWCKDCVNAIPVLLKLEEEIGLEIRSFGKVKTVPLDPDVQWAIPPSPPEMEKWKVKAIPWIEIFGKDGKRIGTIIEKPSIKSTIEEEILYHIKTK
ncbi:MAG: hypothetical protein BAJATHORv1_80035 [Candidatus Thorarchaeota archaeon]|nr:MAG: hypothetical protein BAJATHORv1_80035 [Candidatus Thorarchaeota archaeon]